jgi:hypothetical protein
VWRLSGLRGAGSTQPATFQGYEIPGCRENGRPEETRTPDLPGTPGRSNGLRCRLTLAPSGEISRIWSVAHADGPRATFRMTRNKPGSTIPEPSCKDCGHGDVLLASSSGLEWNQHKTCRHTHFSKYRWLASDASGETRTPDLSGHAGTLFRCDDEW